MDNMIIAFMFDEFPHLKKVGGMVMFLSSNFHLKMERSDLHNDCDWFNEMYKNGWKPCMDAHRDCCRGVFDFDNYDKWVESIDEDYPLPCDNCGESMKYHTMILTQSTDFLYEVRAQSTLKPLMI